MICPHCKNGEVIGEDETYCSRCGLVVQEISFANEVQFEENAAGNAQAVGHYVSMHESIRESRKMTEKNAKERIQHCCAAVGVHMENVKSSAFSFYQSALNKQLTRGRLAKTMTAACVYLAARLLKVDIMLLDLSQAVGVNVYVVGRTYIELCQRLKQSPPEIDPCLYIPRFAAKMELGDLELAVAETAMQLLKRMKKDWISTGRRPAGLAAAALLVAARMFEFNRTHEDVARIARISQQTARKRLDEFSLTASAMLTIEKFGNVDLDTTEDPPAFTAGIKKANKGPATEEEMEQCAAEIKELQRQIDTEMEKLQQKKLRGPWAKYARADGSVPKGVRSLYSMGEGDSSEQDLTERIVLREALEGVVDSSVLEECVDDLYKVTAEPIVTLDDGAGCSSSAAAPSAEDADAMLRTAVLNSVYKPPEPAPPTDGNVELDLTGIDDEEIDREYILTPREVLVKARAWFLENATYLQQVKKKEEEKRKQEEEEKKNPTKKKRRARPRAGPIHANSASEAIRMVIQQTPSCSKLNYDVLFKLENKSGVETTGTDSGASLAGNDETSNMSTASTSTSPAKGPSPKRRKVVQDTKIRPSLRPLPSDGPTLSSSLRTIPQRTKVEPVIEEVPPPVMIITDDTPINPCPDIVLKNDATLDEDVLEDEEEGLDDEEDDMDDDMLRKVDVEDEFDFDGDDF